MNQKKYYLGIDLGGTFIKGAVVDGDGSIIFSDKTPTESEKGADAIISNIVKLCNYVIDGAGLSKTDISGVGMGSPGIVDSNKGVVVYSENLKLKDFPIAKNTEELLGLPVKVANDANAAALGEAIFGSASSYKSSIFITLGTGVGGGVIIDGKLFEGNRGAGTELGHTVICCGGEPCNCGRRGCLEAYASATALIRNTKRTMEAHKDSKLWEIGDLSKVNGKTAFDYYDSDVYAKAVIDDYMEKLGCGIVNFANEFRPEAIILGGGVCAQGDNLIKPLRKIMDREIFAAKNSPKVDLKIAALKNDAGCLGAAALVINNKN